MSSKAGQNFDLVIQNPHAMLTILIVLIMIVTLIIGQASDQILTGGNLSPS